MYLSSSLRNDLILTSIRNLLGFSATRVVNSDSTLTLCKLPSYFLYSISSLYKLMISFESKTLQLNMMDISSKILVLYSADPGASLMHKLSLLALTFFITVSRTSSLMKGQMMCSPFLISSEFNNSINNCIWLNELIWKLHNSSLHLSKMNTPFSSLQSKEDY